MGEIADIKNRIVHLELEAEKHKKELDDIFLTLDSIIQFMFTQNLITSHIYSKLGIIPKKSIEDSILGEFGEKKED